MGKPSQMVIFTTIVFILIFSFSTISIQAAPPPPERTRSPKTPDELQRWHARYSADRELPELDFPKISDAPEWDASPYSKIAYENWFEDGELYLLNGYGSNRFQLTNNGDNDYFPRINRGCTQIVFTSDRDGDAEIFTMNSDGSNVVKRTSNTADDWGPTWSPDGTKIAFQSNRNGNSEIYVMNANGSNQTRLTNISAWDGEPAWSPDGTKIAFTSNRNSVLRIWVMDANGNNQVQLSNQTGSEFPVWSPDGSKIAYDSDGDGDSWWEIWVMDSNGSNQHEVWDFGELSGSTEGRDAYVRSWSPDGRYIAFTNVYWVWDEVYEDYFWWYAWILAFETNSVGTLYTNPDYPADWDPDWQTCDALAPNSTVNTLPAYSPANFLVSWGGTDQTGAGQGLAGVKSYDIQVRDGVGGSWIDWLTSTTATSQTYSGVDGHTYYFRGRARDIAYNLEAYPADYETYTVVDALPPNSAVSPLPPIVNTAFLVSWSGSDGAGLGVQSYDIQYRDGLGGSWTDWQLATTNTSSVFSGTSGHTYYFRSRARDLVNNLEGWPPDYDAYTLLDSDLPTSAVQTLSTYSQASFTVHWNGSDTGGSGLLSYDIQYRDGLSGGWMDWQMGAGASSAPFTGLDGHTYYFRSRARDNALNLEDWPLSPDASTRVDSYAPHSRINPLPDFSHTGHTLEWSGFDTYGGSGIANYDIQFKDTSGGDWTNLLNASPLTTTLFNGTPGHTYLFRSRGRDLVGNLELWPLGNGDTSTTIYTWMVAGKVTDNAGRPIQGASITSTPSMFNAPSSAVKGKYSAYNANSASEYEVTYAKIGYGSLPPASLDGATDAVFDVVLPPADNIIQDWGFESGTFSPAWSASGLIPPTVSADSEHTGEYAALLGDDQGGNASETGSSIISQTVTVPLTMTSATLSMLLKVDGEPEDGVSWFEATVHQDITHTSLMTLTSSTEGWDHYWFDLSAWAGEHITLTFTTHQAAGQPAAWAYLDEISLGSSHPDVWIEKNAWASSVLPGELITYTLTYGIRGTALASQVVLTDTLPSGLSFVSASLTPDATSPDLRWELGDLPAGSLPYTITITAMVVATPPSAIVITNEAWIGCESIELELLNNHAEADTMIGRKIAIPFLSR